MDISGIIYMLRMSRITHKITCLNLFLFHDVAKIWTSRFFMELFRRSAIGRNLVDHVVCCKLVRRSLLLGRILLLPLLIWPWLKTSLILSNVSFLHGHQSILESIQLGSVVDHHLFHQFCYFLDGCLSLIFTFWLNCFSLGIMQFLNGNITSRKPR